MSDAEPRFILAHTWAELGLTFSPDDYTYAEALATIARITGDNFRCREAVSSLVIAIDRGTNPAIEC